MTLKASYTKGSERINNFWYQQEKQTEKSLRNKQKFKLFFSCFTDQDVINVVSNYSFFLCDNDWFDKSHAGSSFNAFSYKQYFIAELKKTSQLLKYHSQILKSEQ